MSRTFSRHIDAESVVEFNSYIQKCYDSHARDIYVNPNDSRIMTKADPTDDPVLGGTTGYDWPNRGPQIWSTINQEANIFGILNKKPFTNRGLTLIVEDEATSDSYADGGATNLIDHPGMNNVDFDLAQVQSRTAYTEIEDLYAKSNGRNVKQILRGYYSKRHAKVIDGFLGAKVDTYDSVGSPNDPISIDRLVASNDEATSVGFTATNIDVYSLGTTRSSGASVYDAYVDHNDGTPRNFDVSLVNTMLDNLEDAGASLENAVFLTGRDTKTVWGDQLSAKDRYFNEKEFKASVNGIVQSRPGVKKSFSVSTYEGIPIMTSINLPKDVLTRLYCVDLEQLWLEIGKPTQWFEMFDPNALGNYNITTSIRTILQTRVADFGVHGKIRDLK